MLADSLKKPVSHASSRFTVLMQPLNSITPVRGCTVFIQALLAAFFQPHKGTHPLRAGFPFFRRTLCITTTKTTSHCPPHPKRCSLKTLRQHQAAKCRCRSFWPISAAACFRRLPSRTGRCIRGRRIPKPSACWMRWHGRCLPPSAKWCGRYYNSCCAKTAPLRSSMRKWARARP